MFKSEEVRGKKKLMSSYDGCLYHLSDYGEKYFVMIQVSHIYV